MPSDVVHSVRTSKGRTPISSNYASPRFDTMDDMINDTLVVGAPQYHADAKKKCGSSSLSTNIRSFILFRPLSAMGIVVK